MMPSSTAAVTEGGVLTTAGRGRGGTMPAALPTAGRGRFGETGATAAGGGVAREAGVMGSELRAGRRRRWRRLVGGARVRVRVRARLDLGQVGAPQP